MTGLVTGMTLLPRYNILKRNGPMILQFCNVAVRAFQFRAAMGTLNVPESSDSARITSCIGGILHIFGWIQNFRHHLQ
jgi:hypothetical protein